MISSFLDLARRSCINTQNNTPELFLHFGYHEFKLRLSERYLVEAGEALGWFTIIPNDNQVVYDILNGPPSSALATAISEVQTPLTFSEERFCRHYDLMAICISNTMFLNMQQ